MRPPPLPTQVGGIDETPDSSPPSHYPYPAEEEAVPSSSSFPLSRAPSSNSAPSRVIAAFPKTDDLLGCFSVQ